MSQSRIRNQVSRDTRTETLEQLHARFGTYANAAADSYKRRIEKLIHQGQEEAFRLRGEHAVAVAAWHMRNKK